MGCGNGKQKTVSSVSVEVVTQTPKPALAVYPNHSNKTLLDIYRMGSALGKGAFAEVKKCEHKATRLDRAVKIYRKDPNRPELRANIMREFNILRTLDHPNIVGIFEHFEDEKKFYMVMEYSKGGEMFNSIAKGANTNEAMVARTMRQVLSALAYIHAKGIVHRDMKPENILFDELGSEQNVKLVDFGEATHLDASGLVEGVCGTSYYIAPEVLSGAYNELCDVWSCGVIMYILLSGKVPFNGENDEEIIARVRTGVYSLTIPEFANVSEEAIDLIKRMISPAETRISAKAALQHPWMKRFFSVTPNEDKMNTTMLNLTKYTRGSLMRETITNFVVSHILPRVEVKKLRDIFLLLNESGTAQLVPEELLKHYNQHSSPEAAEQTVRKIFAELDPEHTGTIEFKAFLCGAIDAKETLSEHSLEAALTVFAVEAGGKANVMEIRRMLYIEPQRLLKAWEEILTDVDKSPSGDIEMEQLVKVVSRKVQVR
jgi:calcium-dependent protein kinase